MSAIRVARTHRITCYTLPDCRRCKESDPSATNLLPARGCGQAIDRARLATSLYSPAIVGIIGWVRAKRGVSGALYPEPAIPGLKTVRGLLPDMMQAR